MAIAKSPRQYTGVRAIRPPDLTLAKVAPTANNDAFNKGQLWLDTVGQDVYMWTGTSWVVLGTTALGVFTSITGDVGGPETPLGGNFSLLGTPNQIVVTGGPNRQTFSISPVFIAPGSIRSLSTITADTSITATLGNITASNGNFVSSTLGKGLVFNSPTATGPAANPLLLNGRTGKAVFTGVNIPASTDLTLRISNSSITGSTTQVMYFMSGCNTGSALSVKSVTNAPGSSMIVVTNAQGAVTSTSNISLNFIVVN